MSCSTLSLLDQRVRGKLAQDCRVGRAHLCRRGLAQERSNAAHTDLHPQSLALDALLELGCAWKHVDTRAKAHSVLQWAQQLLLEANRKLVKQTAPT